jgi:hypothetical protein
MSHRPAKDAGEWYSPADPTTFLPESSSIVSPRVAIAMISAPVRSHRRRSTKLFGPLTAAALGLAMLGSAAADPGPFDGLAGRWAGNGVVTYSDGTKERLTCTVKYDQAEPNSISQSLACTTSSDTYHFKINAYYKNQADSLVGHWDELVLQISGSITGKVANGRISGNLHGPGFEAAVVVDTKGDHQTVTISAPEQRISQVAIAVKKSS